ncbi:putative triacylglycerol lipase [Helianthus annuus]|nr:putative triacylglycerol lipase [Helianthus annuus]
MDAQLKNFAKTRHDIISSIGVPASVKLFANALFTVTTGSNDFINNYFQPGLSKLLRPETFIGTMISAFRKQLTSLYYMGARKIVVTNIPPIGCCPYERDHNPFSGRACVASPNILAQQYNHQLKQTLIELTTALKGSTFIYADVYGMVDDIVRNYKSYGFEIADRACCHVLGLHGGMVPCLQHTKICQDRSKYVFWDWFHVTETTNLIIAKRILDGEINDISPINVQALSQI